MTGPEAVAVPSTDGVTVVAHDHGGGGEPLILCHATGFHGRCWDPICHHLSGTYRCIAIDLRGHGDSDTPEGLDLHWDGMAQDILHVIDHFGFGQVSAAGHSLGGGCAMRAELARPGTIGRAWLFEPIIIPVDQQPPDGRNPMARSARNRREIFESRDAALERYSSRPPFSDVDPEALRAYVEHGFRDLDDGTVILKCRGEVEAKVFESAFNDTFDGLSSVATAVTVAGSGDAGRPALLAPLIAGSLPHGTYEHYGDLTHFAPMEDPARIASAIHAALS